MRPRSVVPQKAPEAATFCLSLPVCVFGLSQNLSEVLGWKSVATEVGRGLRPQCTCHKGGHRPCGVWSHQGTRQRVHTGSSTGAQHSPSPAGAVSPKEDDSPFALYFLKQGRDKACTTKVQAASSCRAPVPPLGTTKRPVGGQSAASGTQPQALGYSQGCLLMVGVGTSFWGGNCPGHRRHSLQEPPTWPLPWGLRQPDC